LDTENSVFLRHSVVSTVLWHPVCALCHLWFVLQAVAVFFSTSQCLFVVGSRAIVKVKNQFCSVK